MLINSIEILSPFQKGERKEKSENPGKLTFLSCLPAVGAA
jgi:hypothetical protein